MDSRTLAVLRRGIEAGMLAGVPQVVLAKAEEYLVLGDADEDADIGPRLVERLADRAGKRLPEDMKWLAASAFHWGYAAAWGALYALLYERRPVHPLVGGAVLASFIWSITFTDWGAAVRTQTERRPRERSWGKELVLATAAGAFGLTTALLYGRGPRRTGRDRIIEGWRRLAPS